MNKSDWKIGQEALIINKRGMKDEICGTATVIKIGRKYVTVSDYFNGRQFEIKTGYEKDNYNYILYPNRAAYNRAQEIKEFHGYLREKICGYGNLNVSYEALKKCVEILKADEKEASGR